MIRTQPKRNGMKKNHLYIKKYKTDENKTQIRSRSDPDRIQIKIRPFKQALKVHRLCERVSKFCWWTLTIGG